MGCEEVRELLGPALDGELDAAHIAQLERHAAACPGCASERRELERLRSAVRGASYHRLEPQGRAAIRRALDAEARPQQPPTAPLRLQRRAALVASVVLGLGLSGSMGYWLGQSRRDDARLFNLLGGSWTELTAVAGHVQPRRSVQDGFDFEDEG